MNRQLALGLQLRASSRFENFVVGTNAEVVAQLRACAGGRGEAFCFLRGSPGTGKTHLLQAACHEATRLQRSAAYASVSGAALQPVLLEGWESFDLACIDDIDAVAGAPRWEEALFHLFNRVRERGGQLLVAAAAAPAGLAIGLPDLVSRLASGVHYRLDPLSDTLLLEALQLRARQRGCEIPDETAGYLLRRLPRDTGSLFDMLERLDQASLAAQRKLTVPFVKSVLGL